MYYTPYMKIEKRANMWLKPLTYQHHEIKTSKRNKKRKEDKQDFENNWNSQTKLSLFEYFQRYVKIAQRFSHKLSPEEHVNMQSLLIFRCYAIICSENFPHLFLFFMNAHSYSLNYKTLSKFEEKCFHGNTIIFWQSEYEEFWTNEWTSSKRGGKTKWKGILNKGGKPTAPETRDYL